MATQEALTLLADVRTDRLGALKALVERMHADPAGNDVIPLGRLESSHFSRLFVLDPAGDPSGRPIEPHLCFMSDCDGSSDRQLEELVRIGGKGIDTLFSHCVGYPIRPLTETKRLAWLRQHRIATATYYVNRPGRTVAQIRAEAQLHDAIESFLDRSNLEELPATQIRNKIRAFVGQTPELGCALEPSESERPRVELGTLLELVGAPAVAGALAPLAAGLLLLVRWQEAREPTPPRKRPSPRHVQELASVVDFEAQNPFTVVGFVKPGSVRRLTLDAVLRLANWGTRHIYNRGNLGGLPRIRWERVATPPFFRPRLRISGGITTIHSARWVSIDDHRRVVFVSNYDGSLESYMDDFIDKVAWGLNLVFSNGQDYPRTRWLIKDGARDETTFKEVNIRHQVPTKVWHSAYGGLTASNIETNSRIRAGLRGTMNERQAREWLSLL